MIEKADLVSVQDYILKYGHEGKHVRITRTRYDKNNISIIQFYLIEIDLKTPGIFIPKLISPEDVMKIFKKYNEDVSESHINSFIQGWLRF